MIFWFILGHVAWGDVSTATIVDFGCVLVLAACAVFVRDMRVAAAGNEQLLGDGFASNVVVSNPSVGAQSETAALPRQAFTSKGANTGVATPGVDKV